MIQVVMCLGAVFTIFILYYFYKPGSECNDENNLSTTIKLYQSSDSKGGLAQVSVLKKAKMIQISDICRQIDLARDTSRPTKSSSLVRRYPLNKHPVLNFNFDSYSLNNLSIKNDMASLNSDNVDLLLKSDKNLFQKVNNVYKKYALSYMQPLCKYLGINDPEIFSSKSSINSSLLDEAFITKSSNQIEDHFK